MFPVKEPTENQPFFLKIGGVDWFVFLECDFAQCFFNTEMDEHRAEEVIFRRHSRRTACIMK
jgi:hypothetical protein